MKRQHKIIDILLLIMAIWLCSYVVLINCISVTMVALQGGVRQIDSSSQPLTDIVALRNNAKIEQKRANDGNQNDSHGNRNGNRNSKGSPNRSEMGKEAGEEDDAGNVNGPYQQQRENTDPSTARFHFENMAYSRDKMYHHNHNHNEHNTNTNTNTNMNMNMNNNGGKEEDEPREEDKQNEQFAAPVGLDNVDDVVDRLHIDDSDISQDNMGHVGLHDFYASQMAYENAANYHHLDGKRGRVEG